MSIEEKAKRYDEVVAMAKECITHIPDEAVNKYMLNMFPELKESDDERIRKELIKLLRNLFNNYSYFIKDPFYTECITWLEKQDFNYTFKIKEGHWYKCVCDYMLNNSDVMFKYDRLYYCRRNWRLEGEIDELNVKDIGVNGYKSFFRPATNQEIKDWLEKQDESDEAKAKVFLINKGYPIDANGVFPTYEEMYNIIREGLEQQSEQKHTDKVESKFKVGDWVILTAGELSTTLQIANVDINKKLYWFNDGSYLPIVDEEILHLWTIEDAKDGDVLAEDSCIFIIQRLSGINAAAKTYCTLFNDGEFNDGTILYFDIDSTKPATQEQRDILFVKMKEAGYEWNKDKKELKKL